MSNLKEKFKNNIKILERQVNRAISQVNEAIGLGLGFIYQGISLYSPASEFNIDGFLVTIDLSQDFLADYLITIHELGVPIIRWRKYLNDNNSEVNIVIEKVKKYLMEKNKVAKDYAFIKAKNIVDKTIDFIKYFKEKLNEPRAIDMRGGNSMNLKHKHSHYKSKENPLNNIVIMLSQHKKKLLELIKKREAMVKNLKTKKQKKPRKTKNKKSKKQTKTRKAKNKNKQKQEKQKTKTNKNKKSKKQKTRKAKK